MVLYPLLDLFGRATMVDGAHFTHVFQRLEVVHFVEPPHLMAVGAETLQRIQLIRITDGVD